MFGNVFVGVDGSPTGRDAIALAAALAGPGARVTLAHVQVGLGASDFMFYATTLGFGAPANEDSQQLLETERETAGVDAELIGFTASSVARGLHTLAEEHRADLLVLGSCSRGLVGRILVGDDTRASLNGAPCAIAIAPRGYAARPAGFAAIGVGYDFSGESQSALAAARELAARYGSKLRVLDVVSPPVGAYSSPMLGNWGEMLEAQRKAADERLESIPGADGTAVYGVAGEELAAAGDRVDLLVVGSRSYGPMRRLVFGSTSSYLVSHARCPLLVLPRSAPTGSQTSAEERAQTQAPVGASS
ncbi:MAG TPA: universal stress protein [Solirubrobacteraceae bacterium]